MKHKSVGVGVRFSYYNQHLIRALRLQWGRPVIIWTYGGRALTHSSLIVGRNIQCIKAASFNPLYRRSVSDTQPNTPPCILIILIAAL
jgi:hypothetical protein